LDGTVVINGVRATYRMVRAADGIGVIAHVQYAVNGPWVIVGGPAVVFPDDASARHAIQSQVAADWSRRRGTGPII